MTEIQVYNTLSRQKEAFQPNDPQHVTMYVCGPTVYDFAHLGNARPVVVFDTLYRLLKRHYPQVTYARNITDVEDKILNRIKETGETIEALTTRTAQAFHDDIAHMNALPPDIEPRATQYIAGMIDMSQKLIEKGFAYAAQGHVLFHVPSMKDYGKLSRHSRDELVAGARVEVAPYKKDPADFVLWKPSTPDQVGWESPWGRGRPGWHIECSVMSAQHLGKTFDIHGGGLDLIFPHHENEIAQSECANDVPLAKYWMHNGFLIVNGEKMSKSLGNFFTIRELLAEAPGEALRLVLLSSHYRQPVNFTREALQNAKATLDRWYGALRLADALPAPKTETVPEKVEAALCDDLNIPQAIAEIHEIVSALYAAKDDATRTTLKADLLAAGHALGLLYQDIDAWFKGDADEAMITQAIADRIAAKKAKDFARADQIRADLLAQGIILEDGPSGTTWRKA